MSRLRRAWQRIADLVVTAAVYLCTFTITAVRAALRTQLPDDNDKS